MVEGALENLLEVFDWLGIKFDESPHIGGDFAPYVQSERLEIYREHINILLTKGSAYHCFCSVERLESMRKAQQAAGRTPMYDRLCRNIPPDESRRRAHNEPFVVRLKIPLDEIIHFKDGVRGGISFESDGIDDQVLLKSDGYPTYHLANVVDDHLMGITDVIRGEEWLISTPKHIQLYGYFGWKLPRFYHLPLLLNPDRSKLSKRQGDVAVEDYRAKGYLPEALINYTALLGWHPADDREFYTLNELIREFSLERVTKAGAIFDPDKLNWLNRRHLSALSDDEFLRRGFEFLPPEFDFTSEVGEKVLKWIREGLDRFSDIREKIKPFTWMWESGVPGEVGDRIAMETSFRVYNEILKRRGETGNWNGDVFKELMKAAGKAAGVKGKDLWMSVRAAATGSLHGPDMALVAEYLGREKFFHHIKAAADFAKGN